MREGRPARAGDHLDLDFLRTLALEADSRVVLLVLDGLGGLPREPGGPTELEQGDVAARGNFCIKYE